MAEIVNMPKLGFDMAEGTLVRWVKQEGEAVDKGDVLAEIETDKATVEVESSSAARGPPSGGKRRVRAGEHADCRDCSARREAGRRCSCKSQPRLHPPPRLPKPKRLSLGT